MQILLCSQAEKYRTAVFTNIKREIHQASLLCVFNYDVYRPPLCLCTIYIYSCVCFVLRLCCSMDPSPKKTKMDLWALAITGLMLNSSWYSSLSLLTAENNTCSPLCVKCQCQLFCCDEVCGHHSSREWLQVNLSDLSPPLSCRPIAPLYILTFFHSLITLLTPSPFEGSNPQSSGPKCGRSPWSQGTVRKYN